MKTPNDPAVASRQSPNRYDALHLIEYEVLGAGPRRRPDTRGLMQLVAAVQLLRRGVSARVIISGVHYGPPQSDERISQLYARLLRERLGQAGVRGVSVTAEAELLPPGHRDQGSKDTGGDVVFLLSQARRHGLRNVLVLASAPHMRRIAQLLRAHGVRVGGSPSAAPAAGLSATLLSAERVLGAQWPAFSHRFAASPYHRRRAARFTRSERLKRLLMLLDRRGRGQSWLAHHLPTRLKLRLQS